MSGPQIFALAGMVAGLGVAMLSAALVRGTPSLAAVLTQLSAEQRPAMTVDPAGRDRWGWMPASVVSVLDRHLGVSDADLRIMGWTRSGLAARKVALALTGLLLPPLLSLMFSARGVSLPVSIPVIASVALAGWMWTIPSQDAREEAAKARAEFRSALAAFLDLVALERLARGSVTEALDAAAAVSDSSPFVAIREALSRAALSGRTPWSALKELGGDLDVEELRNLADIAAVASDGASVYKTLLAESRTLRHAQLSAELAEANKRSERMSMLNSLLVGGLALFIMTALMFRLYQTT